MVDHYGNTHCLAHPDGTVIWVPPSQFTVFCDLDLTYWPYDKQTCMLRVGSWTYDGEQLDLQLDSHGPNVSLPFVHLVTRTLCAVRCPGGPRRKQLRVARG